ncbi:MAG TPA: Nudix family hydrolase [Dyella sp.]|uniref:Nudix family hydrolase n=1 Tax=Dyella sp. TaxID=1869338 RepID=UPI002F956849
MAPPIHVMAGVLRDAEGRVLLAQRPPGKHLAGLWEFPGGKCEPGEAPEAALARELREELGISIESSIPLIRVPWRYERGALCLDTRIVECWQGEPASLEGQALRWQEPGAIDLAELAPADRPILQALRLPERYVITPADAVVGERDAWRARIEAALEQGTRLLQLRFPVWPVEAVRELAAALLPAARAAGASLLLNGDIDGARELGIGVQLKRKQLRACGDERPLPLGQLIAVSCHDADELTCAVAIGADFATLSPVLPTASHPGTEPLGWEHFAVLAESASLPVYALGGLATGHVAMAKEHGAQGVAGIRGFWG